MPASAIMACRPLWDQFAALLPPRELFDPTHPWGCHRRRIADRIVFDKLVQVLRFGCSYEAIADTTCSATTIRDRRDEWIALGVFAAAEPGSPATPTTASSGCCSTTSPSTGASPRRPAAARSPARPRSTGGKQGMKRSVLVEGDGIPLGRVLAGANRHDSPLLEPTLDRLDDLGPLPDTVTVHLDAGYDSGKTRTLLAARDLHGEIAHKGDKAPIQASRALARRAHERLAQRVQSVATLLRTHANDVIDAFFDLADAIITVRSLIRQAWTLYRWDTRPARRP